MSVLDGIVAGVLEDLEARRQRVPPSEIEARSLQREAALQVLPALRAPGLAVISEVKRSSPSKGHLADIPAPADLARSYARGGAAAISVLTERRRFGGSLEDLDAVRDAVATPVLRKEFMVDEYQFHEARAHGADMVLLIVASLDDTELRRFHRLALELGMTPLVETHTADEVDRALELGAELIGINNRNLKTLEVDLATFAPLAARIDGHAVVVAESGIMDADDAQRVADEGADVVLVGEALVRHGDPASAVASMTGLRPRAS